MDEGRLRNKFSHWIDGDLDQQGVRALQQQLKESSEARRQFLESMTAHADLSSQSEGEELLAAIKTTDAPLPSGSVEPGANGHSQGSYSYLYALAASLLLAVGLLWGTHSGPQDALLDQSTAKLSNSADSPIILTQVQPLSASCQWYVEGVDRTAAQSYRAGDRIRVISGNLSLHYTHGTSVVLRSPAAYELISSTRARMIIGRLTATVPEAGKGFTVITPQADVIDLGTEFGVEVNKDGATDVVVFKGEVDLNYHNQETQIQRLQMGQAVRLDAVGTTSRLVSINGESFSKDPIEMATRPPLITEVRDNIERDSTMLSFYEIVAGGMKEDALAYVDRIAHEYNGISKDGMPSYLVGGDYVKMFNNDKYLKSIRVDVALTGPANLYVLLDNRREPPEWLTKEFRDTGDDVGLDTGPFKTHSPQWHNKGPSGVGPGESVEDELSIWVKEVSTPRVVHLGPMGTTTEVGANMYGIVATPLQVPTK